MMLLNEFSPSRLFYIEPIGIGTSYVESLPSYIKRLAEAHSTTVGRLLAHEIFPDKKDLDCFIGYNTPNALRSNSANTLVDIIERKSRVSNLVPLALNTLFEFITPYHSLRHALAWCPLCFEENQKFKEPVYEPLIWLFNDVNICKKHQVTLMHVCPCCNSVVFILTHSSKIGYCNKCKNWLGYKQNEIMYPTSRYRSNWIYDNISEILAVLPLNRPSCFQSNVNYIINSDIAKKLNLSSMIYSNWLIGKKPRLSDVLELSYETGFTLKNLLLEDIQGLIRK